VLLGVVGGLNAAGCCWVLLGGGWVLLLSNEWLNVW